jgi:hypothetical protein
MEALDNVAIELQTRYPHFDSTMYISCFKEEDLQQLGVCHIVDFYTSKHFLLTFLTIGQVTNIDQKSRLDFPCESDV